MYKLLPLVLVNEVRNTVKTNLLVVCVYLYSYILSGKNRNEVHISDIVCVCILPLGSSDSDGCDLRRHDFSKIVEIRSVPITI